MRTSLIPALTLALAALLAACSDSSDRPPAPPEPEIPEPEEVTLLQETLSLPSAGQPAHTPGSPGVVVSNPGLLAQFGEAGPDFNRAVYTRYYLSDQADRQPDAILVLIPGFAGGASNYYVLADNLLRNAQAQQSLALEVWAFDRRSNLLEDTVGLDIAEDQLDIEVGLDFLFGEELGLPLSDALVDDPGRRAMFYNSAADTAFMAQWTSLVHSQDIDAVVEAALDAAAGGNVFLGGHSAGTGYTARYAATDFDLGDDATDPGYRKVRGLILFEGGGASLAGGSPDDATLDLVEARFDGGLFGAVRDQAPRCSDGETACTVETEATDCAALENTRCVVPTAAYSDAGGLLSPQLQAVSEITALDVELNGQATLSILQVEQNDEPGNSAINQVPELAALKATLGEAPATSLNLLGQFLDDDGVIARFASFVATSLGFPGPEVDGLRTWLGYGEDLPDEATPDLGPAPESLADVGRWGQQVEPSDLAGHMLPMFYRGQTNFSEWYYPSSGLAVVQGEGLGLDTSALSAPPPAGRGRSDIENRTQAGAIDVPVIAFGGSNGLTPTPASWLGFARAIGPCAAPACDGVTGRLVDQANPSEAFPTFGDVAGGFEVYIVEGYAHLDVLTAEDDADNGVLAPLLDFVVRHLQ